LVWKN